MPIERSWVSATNEHEERRDDEGLEDDVDRSKGLAERSPAGAGGGIIMVQFGVLMGDAIR